MKWVAQEFRNLERPLTADMLLMAFDFEAHPDFEVDERYQIRECGHCLTKWLTI